MEKKRQRRGVLALLMLFVMLVGVLPVKEAGAKTLSKAAEPEISVAGIELYMKGDYSTSYQLQFKNLAENAKVTFSSSKKKVATVDAAGLITPVKKGKSNISVKVKQNRKTYRFNVACSVKEASLSFNSKKAKKSTALKPMSMTKGKWYNPGLQLDGAGKISVYSSSNSKKYNVRAVIYNAKTGKRLAYAKNSNNNRYLTISKKGVITANRKGSYYIVFTSYPAGCSTTLYLDVKNVEKKEETPTDVPSDIPSDIPTAIPDDKEDRDDKEDGKVIPVPYVPSGNDGPYVPTVKSEYQISFALADDCKQLKAELPEARTYKDGEKIGKLPQAYLQNAIFLGWYYDAQKTKPVNEKDRVYESKTLFGELRMSEEQKAVETPKYAVVTVPADKVSSFSFMIKGYQDGCIESFINSASSENIAYSVSSEKISPVLEKGKTYHVTLKEDFEGYYVIDGKEKDRAVRELTIMTDREEVQNLSLAEGIDYIRADEISNLKGEIFDGLFSANVGSNGTTGTNENRYEGSFEYNGTQELRVGDLVAIYEGKRPDQRTFDDYDTEADGAVAYVTVTEKNGNTYGFKSADTQDVLKQTEILPVPASYNDGESNKNTEISVPMAVLNYSDPKYAKLGLDEKTTVDVGDYLMFYEETFDKALSGQGGDSVSYAKVTGVSQNGSSCTIKYVSVTKDDVLSSMDMYNKRNVDINLTEEQKQQIADSIQKQAMASGFLDEAADYLVALSMETDGFKELSDDLDMDLESYDIRLVDGTELSDTDRMMLMDDGWKAKITKKEARVNFRAPEMFKDESAYRIELTLTMQVSFGEDPDNNEKDHLELELQAYFAEEVLFDIGLDGGAVWEWAGIFPYIDDYEVSANLDWGTAVEAGVTATLKTVKGKDPKIDWKKEGVDADNAILNIGKQIKDLMLEKEQFMGETILDEDGEEIGAASHAGGLVDKYEAFMEDAQKDEAWINLVEKEIFSLEGSIDPFHVLVYGVSAKFVIKANIYITIGATYDAGEGTRYIFYMRIFDRSVDTSEETIMEPHVNYDFYVFGTLGLKVGLEFEFGVGLFSLKLDSVGITAELGIYFQLAGFFYVHYTETVENGVLEKDSSMSGAICFEVGFYVEVKFKAQLLSDNKLTYSPTLYDDNWPLWTLGEREHVYDFHTPEEGDDDYTDEPDEKDPDYPDYDEVIRLVCDKSVSIPNSTFEMDVIDLLNGETFSKNFDDAKESRYVITFSNPNFSYDPLNNLVILQIPGGNDASDKEETDMTITWGGSPLAFTSKAIDKKFKILWTDPANARVISFDSKGGSRVSTIAASSGSAIKAPADPKKTGYDFAGWYEERTQNAFTVPSVMPNYSVPMKVYAKWEPRNDTKYTVNHYVQGADGRYELKDADIRQGTTDSTPNLDTLKKNYEGCNFYKSVPSVIRPDGTSVMAIYYTRVSYDITFTYGDMKGKAKKGTQDVKLKAKDGLETCVPVLSVPGYDFVEFQDAEGNALQLSASNTFIAKGAATYKAVWKLSENTPYTVEHYVLNPETGEYELADTVICKGKTESQIDLASIKSADAKYLINDSKTKAVNTDIQNPVINAEGDTVIRFYYDRNSYTLTYKKDQENYCEPANIKWGSKLSAPAAPSKQGYTFTGWFTDSACSEDNIFDFEKDVMPAAAMTLYAGWKGNGNIAYTVEHYVQNADDDDYSRVESETLYGKAGDEVTAERGYFSEYYIWDEEYNAEERTGKINGDGSTVLKLYYCRLSIIVNLDPAGGTLNSKESVSFRYGQKFSVPAPSRDGYAFAGWYDVNNNKYEGPVNGSVSLTAHWTKGEVNYTVKHYVMDVNGKYQENEDPAKDKPTRVQDDMSDLEDTELVLSDLKDTSLEVADGITFKCAKVGPYDAAAVKATVSDGLVIRLYYERSSKNVIWNFDSAISTEDITNNGSYTTGSVYYGSVLVKPVISMKGYTVKYSYNGSSDIPEKVSASDMSIDVIADANKYKVKFDKNASDAVDSTQGKIMAEGQDMTYGTSEKIKTNYYVRDNYTFEGWALSPLGEVKYADKESVLNLTAEAGGEVTLYAVWQGQKYNVSLMGINGKKVSEDNDVKFSDIEPEITEYYYGEKTKLPVPVKDGYTFLGWFEKYEASRTGGYSAGPVVYIPADAKEDKTYYAKWGDTTYTIKWDGNGRDEFNSDISELVPMENQPDYTTSGKSTAVDEYSYIFAPADPTRKPSAQYTYTFDGWYTERLADSDSSEKTDPSYVDMGEYPDITGDITYYAHWIAAPRSYTIRWYLNYRYENGILYPDKEQSTVSSYERDWNKDLEYLKEITPEFTGSDKNAVEYGTPIIVPNCVMSNFDEEDKSYEFKGWYNLSDVAFITDTVDAPAFMVKSDNLKEAAKPLSLDSIIEGRDDDKNTISFVAVWEEREDKYYDITWTINESDRNTEVTFPECYTGKNGKVPDGTQIIAPTPVKAPTETETYRFEGWKLNGTTITDFGSVHADAEYIAAFTPVPRYYDVKFEYLNGEGTKTVSIRYEQWLRAADASYANKNGMNENAHGYNADYPAAYNAAYTDIGGKYTVGTYYSGTGYFRGWYVFNAQGKPVDISGNEVDKPCTWNEFYENSTGYKLKSDLIVKAEWDYDFWLFSGNDDRDGARISSFVSKDKDIANPNIGGRVYFDAETMTLTLDNVRYVSTGAYSSCVSNAELFSNHCTLIDDTLMAPVAFGIKGVDLKIVLRNDNVIDVTNVQKNGSVYYKDKDIAAIFVDGSNLEISGDGSLSIHAGYKLPLGYDAATYGIYLTDGDYVQKGSKVQIQSGAEYDDMLNSWSIYKDSDPVLEYSLSDTSAESYGISAKNCILDCRDGRKGTLTVYAAIDHLGYGIDGYFTAKGYIGDISCWIYGHRAYHLGAADELSHCSCNQTGCSSGWLNSDNQELNLGLGTNSCNYHVYCESEKAKETGWNPEYAVWKQESLWNEILADYYGTKSACTRYDKLYSAVKP